MNFFLYECMNFFCMGHEIFFGRGMIDDDDVMMDLMDEDVV